jgi:hypothetical protein
VNGVDLASSALADGVASRMDELEAALARYASFAFEPTEGHPSPPEEGDAHAFARELVLRALRTVSDPLNYRILARLTVGDATLVDLSRLVDLPHLAAWEQVNDLVQAGLAARSLRGDGAGVTAAGRALHEWIEEVSHAAAEGRKR